MTSSSEQAKSWMHSWMWGNKSEVLYAHVAKSHFTLPVGGGLIDLRRQIESVVCDLKLRATNMVFGDGDPNAALMVIGEAPGREEDRQGLPFVGRSGNLLNQMLSGIGLRREQVYITNMIPWRPPENRAPTEEEVCIFLPYVLEHIKLIAPQVVLLLGSTATRGFFSDSKTPLHQLTNKWYRINDVRVIATYHPSYLMRVPTKKAETWSTLVKIKRWLDDQTINKSVSSQDV